MASTNRSFRATVERVNVKARASKIAAGDGPWPTLQIVLSCDVDVDLLRFLGRRAGSQIIVGCEDYQGELGLESPRPDPRQLDLPPARAARPRATRKVAKRKKAKRKPRTPLGVVGRPRKPKRETIFDPEPPPADVAEPEPWPAEER